MNKKKFRVAQPAKVLLTFFSFVLTIFLLFVVWQLNHWIIFGISAPTLNTQNWLFLIGVVAGIAGWVCSSFVTMRNSIKQHTVSIYIQSRLSSPYAEISKRVNLKHFSIGCVPGPIPREVFANPENAEMMHDINMVLNYFEFIAVGLRHGDLDESMLKKIMRSMITNMCSKASLYIEFVRNKENGIGGEHSFEHLLWLNERWKTL
ncbi:DUF4760 domain-containing protein [Massilia sp. UMI-21]|nr:DUF4760 domain-containing protein [Massilia sp. UMI-21]